MSAGAEITADIVAYIEKKTVRGYQDHFDEIKAHVLNGNFAYAWLKADTMFVRKEWKQLKFIMRKVWLFIPADQKPRSINEGINKPEWYADLPQKNET